MNNLREKTHLLQVNWPTGRVKWGPLRWWTLLICNLAFR